MKTTFDLIIIGGGMVGTSMACALANTSLKIALIENHIFNDDSQPSFDERTLALNYSSYQILSALGIWSEIKQDASPITDIEISELKQSAQATLSCFDVATPALGYTIPARALGQALYKKLNSANNIELICPAQASSVSPENNSIQINLANQQTTLSAKLLVLADGGRSPLRQQLGFQVKEQRYPQHILVATLQMDKPHHGKTFEYFTPSGPLALLPVRKNDYGMIWTVSDEELETYKTLSDDEFLAKLIAAYGAQAGEFLKISPRKSYPLSFSYVDTLIKNRTVVIGNAAHTVHPIGAQGFNLGLKDVAELAETIHQSQQQDIGDASLLRHYEKQRGKETNFVLYFTDFLLQVFSNDFLPLKISRNLGLSLIDKLNSVKQTLLKHTLGFANQQTQLSKGLPLFNISPKTAHEHYDIVIVGSGLVGSALACTLANSQYRIALVDKTPPPVQPQGDFELRINAYNRTSENLLREINVWDKLPAERIFPFHHVYVGSEGGRGCVSFSADDLHEPYIGHFIENQLVTHYLLEQVKCHDSISLVTDEVIGLEQGEHQTQIILANGDVLAADLLVGCDGPNSRIRTLMDIETNNTPYHQKCIVGTVKFDGDHASTAWQRFLPTGPVGLLPLAPGYCSLAWSCERHLADYLLSLTEVEFIKKLDEAIQGHLGQITAMPKRAAFPLTAKHATHYTSKQTVLLGDAAHAIHPLAGLGANLGFQDVITLQKLLQEAQAKNQPLTDEKLLQEYERARRLHNQAILSSMTAFNTLFSNNNLLLKGLRNIGLSLANKISPAKKIILRHAMWMS